MLRISIGALALSLLAGHANAQHPPDNEKTALGQMVMEGIQREAALRAELIATKAELAKAKQPTPDHTSPKD